MMAEYVELKIPMTLRVGVHSMPSEVNIEDVARLIKRDLDHYSDGRRHLAIEAFEAILSDSPSLVHAIERVIAHDLLNRGHPNDGTAFKEAGQRTRALGTQAFANLYITGGENDPDVDMKT